MHYGELPPGSLGLSCCMGSLLTGQAWCLFGLLCVFGRGRRKRLLVFGLRGEGIGKAVILLKDKEVVT